MRGVQAQQERPRAETPTLRGPWLVSARAAWVVIAVLVVALFITSAPVHYRVMLTVCSEGQECESEQLNARAAHDLNELGLSLGFFAAYITAIMSGSALVTVAIAVLVFLKRSNDPVGLFVSLTLLLFAGLGTGGNPTVDNAVWVWLQEALSLSSFACLIILFLTFPDGKFIPRWTRIFLGVWFATTVLLFWVLPRVGASEEQLAEITGSYYMLAFGIPLFAQVYRYRRAANAVQRQQTKWVVAGIAVFVVGVLSTYSFLDEDGILFPLVGAPVIFGSSALIPVSIAFSILRYRLWDIDALVNRALVYGLLTGFLALFYFGTVVVLQAAFRAATGQETTLALVASTLAIAALFQPVRRRLQAFIDRRFYRRKYDAVRTLAAFGATARDEVDLERLSEALVGAVEETMQPAHVSLWLRDANAEAQRSKG